MSIFTRVFNVLGRRNYVPAPEILSDQYDRPVFQTPPVPTGEWSLIVDENGDRVTTREALPTDMLARKPVAYNYGGTLPKFEEKGDIRKNLAGIIEYETRAQANKENLDKAVFLLSQTDDGRRLLDHARSHGFTIVFHQERMEKEGALGLADYQNKLVPLAEGRSPAEVALTLKHELQHMEDMTKGAGYSYADTPQSARMTDRAMEANARVSESVAAAEALLGSPQGPAQQFRTPALFRNFWQKNQPMAEEAHAALPKAAKGKWQAFAAQVFPAYLEQHQTLDGYDTRYANYLKKLIPDVNEDMGQSQWGSRQDEREESKRRVDQATANANAAFTREQSPQEVAAKMMLRGQSYLEAGTVENMAQKISAKALPLLKEVKSRLLTILPYTDKIKLLDATAREDKPATKLPNPYKPFLSELTGPDIFQPVIMPKRIDGPALSNGQKANAAISQFLTGEVKGMKSGRTETDRLNFSITSYIHQGAGTANLRGLVGDLLEAGLRGPVAAFPPEYLQDLYQRMYLAAQSGVTGDNSTLSRQELKLMRHWQDMQDKGLDPVWIDKENKAQSLVGDSREIALYASYLVKGLKTAQPQNLAQTPAQKQQQATA